MPPVEMVGDLAKYPGFKQMLSGQYFCTILAVSIYDYDQLKQLIVCSKD